MNEADLVSASPGSDEAVLIFGSRWSIAPGDRLSYSFPGQECAPFGDAEREAVRDALLVWSAVVDVRFEEVADDGSGFGTLRIAYTTVGMSGGELAYSYAPDDAGNGGDVWLNAGLKDGLYTSFVPGSLGSFVLLHELGHALGLKHPHAASPYNGATLPAERDSVFETIMSYYAAPGLVLGRDDIDRLPTTPMALDIDALQALYGANAAHNGGDDVYTYDADGKYLETIYDTGGIDTIRVTGSRAAEIDLRANEWSRLGIPVQIDGGILQQPDTVRIHRDSVIENAIGGDGGDRLVGNAAANRLEGGRGADVFVLGAGAADVIVDFDFAAGDRLDLSPWLALGDAAGDDLFSGGYLRLSDAGDDLLLWFDADGSSGGAPSTCVAQLLGVPALPAVPSDWLTVSANGAASSASQGGAGAGSGLDGNAQAFAIGAGTNLAPTFSVGNGVVFTELAQGASTDNAQSIVVQADGKIVVGGFASGANGYDFALVRYNADGSLDRGFSGDGKVIADLGSAADDGISLAVRAADGTLALAGYTWNGTDYDFAITRHNSDGSADTAFSGDGQATAGFSHSVWNTASGSYVAVAGTDSGQSVLVQSDGKIVVAGSTQFTNYSYRYDPNYPYYSSSYPYLWGYHYYYHSDYDIALARFNADGTRDTSFSIDGLQVYAYSAGDERIYDAALDASGRIVVVGSTLAWNGTRYDYDLVLVRYGTTGTVDNTFLTNANNAFASAATDEEALSIAIQADNKIVVAGRKWNGSNWDFALYRFNEDGTKDTTFGSSSSGKVATAIGASNDSAQSVVIQSDGKILVAGTSQNGNYYDFALARYKADGTLDTSFSGDGKLTTGFNVTLDSTKSVTLQDDGKILVAGYGWNGNNTDFAVVRYNPDGSQDLSFGGSNSLNGAPIFTEDGAPVVLDADVRVYDAELAAAGSYAGATLTLARHGGASADDAFVATGSLGALVHGGNMTIAGTVIGTVTQNTAGTLTLAFNASATAERVAAAMQSIAYLNLSDAPPASVQIDWSFADGNGGSQGSGGARSATGSTTVTLLAADDAAPAFSGTATGEEFSGTVIGDRLYGRGGDDVLYGNGGNDLIDGGDGLDVLYGGPGHDVLSGGAGTDMLDGGSGNDRVYGGDGSDMFMRSAGEGDDTLAGGGDGDWFYFRASGTGGGGTVSVSGDAGDDWFAIDIGSAAGLDLGSIEISGGDGQDVYIHVAGYATSGAMDPNSIPELDAISLPQVVVSDFTAGSGGDRIALSFLLELSASKANGYVGGNPFNAGLRYFRLATAAGGGTTIEWDMDGTGDKYAWQPIMTLQGVAPSQLTADNFVEHCSPDGLPGGTAPVGESYVGDIAWFYGALYGLQVSQNDLLTGGYAQDVVFGYGGNDSLNGYAGDDSLDGGDGDDLIYGWAGDDTLRGGAGNDTLYGNRGNDRVYGDAGMDLLMHGAGNGNDTLDGGADSDVFVVASGNAAGTTEAVVIDGGDGNDFFWTDIAGSPVTGTIQITGGLGQDVYVPASGTGAQPGLSVTDFKRGTGGDIIYVDFLLNASASGANGYVDGNPFRADLGYLRLRDSGADTLLEWDIDGVRNGADFKTVMVLKGVSKSGFTAANFFGGIAPDGSEAAGLVRDGTAAADGAIEASYAGDTLRGLAGNDTLLGYAGADRLDGGDGDDLLSGFSGNDTILGGDGNDQLVGDMGDDSLDGGDGNDELLYNYGEGNDTLAGGAGDDRLWLAGGSFAPAAATVSALGGAGQDLIAIDIGTPGAGVVDIIAAGGSERDEYAWAYADDNDRIDGIVVLPALTITDFVAGAGGDDFDVSLLLEASALMPSRATAPGASGAAAPSYVPSVSGFATGSGVYTGGNPFELGYLRFIQADNNTLFQWDRDGATQADGSGSLFGYQTVATLQDVQATRIDAHNFKSVVNDPTDGDDLVWGGLGVDSLTGGAGNDILDGNLGPDYMAGGFGGDTYYVDDVGDEVVEVQDPLALDLKGDHARLPFDQSQPINTVIATVSYILPKYVRVLKLTTAANLSGTGNDSDNQIDGTVGDNLLDGREGNDTLSGGDGIDTVWFSGNRSDYAITATSTGYTVVDSVAGRDGTDVLIGIEKLKFADVAAMNLGSNNAPSGAVTIGGTPSQGQTLTASNTLADADGLGTIAYQWQADGSDIAGATGASFVPTQAQVGKAIAVVARYTDAFGSAEQVASAATAAVANSNDAPSGSVTIAGTPTQGQTLTASNTLADADGLGAIVYQWQADGSDIAGATGANFVPTQAQVGKTIAVVARYTDALGTAEQVASAATAAVANLNDTPTGKPAVAGAAAPGQMLTASPGTLADADGLGTVAYQWQAGDGTNWNDAGTGATLALTDGHLGKQIRLIAAYTDAYGTAESVASAPVTVALGQSMTVQAYHWKSHALMAGVDLGEGRVTGNDGSHTFAASGTVSMAPTLAADANAGNAVDLADAIAILKMIVGLGVNSSGEALSPYQAIAADYDESGTVTLSDAIGVLKHVVGLPDNHSPKWAFADEADASMPARANNSPGTLAPTITVEAAPHAGLVGILRGDVDGKWNPPPDSALLDPGYFSSLVASLEIPGVTAAQWGLSAL